MKQVPDRTGRFARRPHYEPHELDRECEQIISCFLRSKYGKVDYPVSTDDLTTLIEKHVDDLDLYADLSEFGQGVEGLTVFNPGGKPSVRIAKELAGDSRRENRLRTTLTHEFGHVHFHSYLWDPQAMTLDFGDELASQSAGADRIQVCKRDTIVNAAVSDWMEWQAGHVCGALLMPATHVRNFMGSEFPDVGPAPCTPTSALGAKAIQAVCERYLVSQDAARVRLLRLGLLAEPGRTASLFQ